MIGNPIVVNQERVREEVEDEPLLEKMRLFEQKYVLHEKPIGGNRIEDADKNANAGTFNKVVPMETNEDIIPAVDAEDERWWKKYNSKVSEEDWLFCVARTATRD